MFAIRRRSNGKIVESGFENRESAKPKRNSLNEDFYKGKNAPETNLEFYVVRSSSHRRGASQ